MRPQVRGVGANMGVGQRVENCENGAHIFLQRIGSFGTEVVDLPNLIGREATSHWLRTVVRKIYWRILK